MCVCVCVCVCVCGWVGGWVGVWVCGCVGVLSEDDVAMITVYLCVFLFSVIIICNCVYIFTFNCYV